MEVNLGRPVISAAIITQSKYQYRLIITYNQTFNN